MRIRVDDEVDHNGQLSIQITLGHSKLRAYSDERCGALIAENSSRNSFEIVLKICSQLDKFH